MDRIEAVGVQRIIKVHRVELRLYLETMVIIQQFIQYDSGKVRIFVVIDEHRISFAEHLPDEMPIYGSSFSASGNTQNQCRPLR